MFVHWRQVLWLLPLIAVVVLVIFEDRVSIPSCEVVPSLGQHHVEEDHPDDLKVMMVANLLLLGSEARYTNIIFRDYYLSRFFKYDMNLKTKSPQYLWPNNMTLVRCGLVSYTCTQVKDLDRHNFSDLLRKKLILARKKSFEILKPDMLLILGDVSARGSKLTRSKWSSVLQQFHRLLGPFLGLPFHVVLGDRDVGDCSDLNVVSVNWIAGNLPALDSAGCGAFEISNISFVSLNAVALLCGHNSLRFSVEKVIERESIDLRIDGEQETEVLDGSSGFRLASSDLGWRENAMSSGSGPVLLLHFPLQCSENSNFWGTSANCGSSKHSYSSSTVPEYRGSVGAGPYDLLHTLPPNATEYIFQALRPRMIFSAHSHNFCDRTHSDGTREITVPAMSWDARNDPAFVVATFKRNDRIVIIRHCALAKESNVLIAYFSVVVVFLSSMVFAKSSRVLSLGS